MEKAEFMLRLAENVPCRPVALPEPKLRWRFEKPAKDMEKPLTSDAGYNAMIAALKERKKDRVVIIAMPPPQEVKENIVRPHSSSVSVTSHFCQPWDTGEDDQVPDAKFEYDYDEVGSSSASVSMRTQMVYIFPLSWTLAHAPM